MLLQGLGASEAARVSAPRVSRLFVVSAPSGAGKTSLVNALVGDTEHLVVSVSHTTRPQRPGERDGVDYHFVDLPRFQVMVARGEFLEHAVVFDNHYGTSRASVDAALAAGQDVVFEIDWQGARRIREIYPDAVSIFIMPPSAAKLRQRLEARAGDRPDVIDRRMQAAAAEISHYTEYRYLVVNDQFDRALRDLRAIVHATRLETAMQAREWAHEFAGMVTPR